MEFVAAGLLFLLLMATSVSAPGPAVPDAVPIAVPMERVEVVADTLPPCGAGVLYRNLSVPAEQAVYQSADGQPCDPDGGR